MIMVLMAICGELGAGKTLCLTYFAYRNWCKGKDIYSNYKLAFPHKFIGSVRQIDTMTQGFFAGDELWLWLDSRCSISKKNKVVSAILLKSRKRDVHICYTTQSFNQVDRRVRNITDFIAIPKLNPREDVCRVIVFTNPSLQPVKTYKFLTNPIFDLYDTTEEIDILDMEDD